MKRYKQSLLVKSGLYAGCGLGALDDFTGRQWLFDDIEAWQQIPANRVLAVVGPPGAGKTSAFAELAYRQATTSPDQRWLSAAWSCSDHRASPESTVVALAEQFSVSVPGFRDALLNPPDEAAGSPSRIDVRSDVRVERAIESTIIGVQIDLHGSSVLDAVERLLRRPLARLALAQCHFVK